MKPRKLLIGYVEQRGATYPALIVPVANVEEAREIAASIRARPGPRITGFDVMIDGRNMPLNEKGVENESQGTKCIASASPKARRIHAGQSAALAG